MSPAAPRGPRQPPMERVRAAFAARAGSETAARIPAGYVRLGRVVLVRWPAALRPHFSFLAGELASVLGAETVLRVAGPVDGELRTPRVELLFGETTETEVVEHGIRWRFDAARLMFAAGNRTERERAGRLVHPGQKVVDLFAGIGYFAIPAARLGGAARVVAVDRNPVAVAYLEENARLNRVADRVEPLVGDNRTVPLPTGEADHVFLGYLPSALPWVERAVPLLARAGGDLHVHTVADSRGAVAAAEGQVERAVEAAGGTLLGRPRGREVKPYGPGRTHVVVDVRVRPGRC
ncbi:MAG TPA: methyltransferase domain-containing protein [Thermoplasmata archaeon]|nr:methyltransferase domain-containing protein [Thermoplasmata archaeon]